MTSEELRQALHGANERRVADGGYDGEAYQIIGLVSGCGKVRVRAIAEGAEPTAMELMTLWSLS